MVLSSISHSASFQGLGDLPGGDFYSYALDISGDGSVVVGASHGSMSLEAFRWTKSNGIQSLGALPGASRSIAFAVSSDGSVMAGTCVYDNSPQNNDEAFKWTQATGMIGLGGMNCGPGFCDSDARGISGNGQVIVGDGDASAEEPHNAFRWTQAIGMQSLGDPTETAYDTSYDGSVIVGYGVFAVYDPEIAFRWTQSGGIQNLGTLGGSTSHAYAVSRDGTVTVGSSQNSYGFAEAFKWSQATGMVGLGSLWGGFTEALGVSADGSVIVGTSENFAFIYDQDNGMRPLEILLQNYGLDVNGWEITYAESVSDDGLTIVGSARNPSGNNEAYIATLTMIQNVDYKKTDNMQDHHTDSFNTETWSDNALILRRGQTFDIDVELTDSIDDPLHICFVAKYYYEDEWHDINIPYFENEVPPGQWGTKRITPVNPDDPLWSMQINIPPDAPAGRWILRTQLMGVDTNLPPLDMKDSGTIAIMYNPWESADSVYMPSSAERNEYILNENGLMWYRLGTYGLVAEWDYDQFDETCFGMLVVLLEQVDIETRANPVELSRYLSAIVNSEDDSGILVGRWESPYTDGIDPTSWKSSSDIFASYFATGQSVKYGQCWSFSGLLCSLFRCVGIPSRPVTNYSSLWDKTPNTNRSCNIYETKEWSMLSPSYCDNCLGPTGPNGYRQDICRSDRIWSYHIWCEAWMKRPDRPGLNGWQAVDATPLEQSDGRYRMGPAPVEAVRQDLGGIYDVNFVFAAVNTAQANIWKYTVDVNGQMHDPNVPETKPIIIGQNISTKAVGNNSRNVITTAYKYAPPPPFGSLSSGSSDFIFSFAPPETALLGSDVIWTVNLENTSNEAHTLTVDIMSEVISYRGDSRGKADEMSKSLYLEANEANSVSLIISEPEYMPWLSETKLLQAHVRIFDENNQELFFDMFKRTYLIEESIDINLIPTENFCINGMITCEISWTNPLSITLHDVNLIFHVTKNLEIDGKKVVEVNIPDLAPSEEIQISKTISSLETGLGWISVQLMSDELKDIRGFKDIAVVERSDFNLDRTVNFIDYSQLANAWQTIDPNYSLDDNNDIEINDLKIFIEDWLWSI